MKEFLFFFISVMILLSVVQHINKQHEVERVKSLIDNRSYVVRKLPDSQKACDRLATLNKHIDTLFKQIKEDEHPPKGVDELFKRYKHDNLMETLPGSKYTSYSVNKGEEISLCIREGDNTFIDINIIMFVFIHELAHIMTDEVGHTKTFWDNMKYLLEQCEKCSIYKPENYYEAPVHYCGMRITTTPYDFEK